MTPEERAQNALFAQFAGGKRVMSLKAAVTSAIREAQASARDDALEEAAQLPIMKHHQATAIRNLKSKG